MKVPKIYEGEYRMCLILWDHEPIGSGELSRLCYEQLGWAKTTTYTVIHKLEVRGFLKREKSIITTLYSKEQIQQAQLEEMVDKTFQRSVPAFIAAFSRSCDMSPEDVAALEKLIEKYED